jgi:hypothetical protein
MHPLDKNGKTPLNLEHGVFSVDPARNATVPALSASGGQKWETVKSPQRDALSGGLVATTAPVRTSRTLIEGSSGTRIVSLNHDSSITYDPHEHRFVNNNAAPPSVRETEPLAGKNVPGGARNDHITQIPPTVTATRVASASAPARATAPPSRSMAPPPASRSSSSGGGGGTYSGGGASSRASSAPSSSASHASASSSGGGGGGRPH